MAGKSRATALEFEQYAQKIDFNTFTEDPASRYKALSAARALVRRLETPIESIWEMTYNYPALYASCKVALENDIFNKLNEGNEEAKSTSHLAGSSMDPGLLRRILRHLSAMHIIRETEPDMWASTRQSRALCGSDVYAAVDYADDVTFPIFLNLPKYLEKTGYENPSEGKGNWEDSVGASKSFFQWMSDHPRAETTFANHMNGCNSMRGSWLNIYPTERLYESVGHDDVVVVDVGGGIGQDMRRLQAKHPQASGRLIFQDLPSVIEGAPKLEQGNIEGMAHDFFRSQPVQGARAYLINSCLHDWPDKEAEDILRQIRPAMLPRTSRLLISEMVIENMGADRQETSLDLTMMALFNARERTEREWTHMLDKVGYRVVKIWRSDASFDCVIEAEIQREG